MGLFGHLLQQSQISDQSNATASLEARVTTLEEEIRMTQELQRRLIELLETQFGRDIDGDGAIG